MQWLAQVLAVLAVAIRIVIPSGTMAAPPAHAGEFVTLRICTGQGAVDADVDLKTNTLIPAGSTEHDKHDGDTSGHAPCTFSPVAAMASPLVELQPTSDASELSPQLPATSNIAAVLGLAAPPPWSTGPPLLI